MRAVHLHELFGILYQSLAYLHPFIYSVIYLYQTHGYYFILWVVIQYQCTNFIAMMASGQAVGSSFSRLPCPYRIGMFSQTLLIPCVIPTPPGVPHWLCMFPDQAWNQPILQAALHITREQDRNQELSTHCACCFWGVTASWPFCSQSKRSLCADPCEHMHPLSLHVHHLHLH